MSEAEETVARLVALRDAMVSELNSLDQMERLAVIIEAINGVLHPNGLPVRTTDRWRADALTDAAHDIQARGDVGEVGGPTVVDYLERRAALIREGLVR